MVLQVYRLFRKILLQDLCFFLFILIIYMLQKNPLLIVLQTILIYYVTIKFLAVSDVIKSELKLVLGWLRANKLSLNESKIKLLLLRPINKLNLISSGIKLKEHLLTLAKSVTYLGIEIDKTLSWNNQIEVLAKNSAELTEFFLNLDIARSSHQRCSVKKGALKNFAKFTEKHLCQSLFLIKLQA